MSTTSPLKSEIEAYHWKGWKTDKDRPQQWFAKAVQRAKSPYALLIKFDDEFTTVSWLIQNCKALGQEGRFDAYRANGKTESLADALQQIDGYLKSVS